jgi:hypothetical protein
MKTRKYKQRGGSIDPYTPEEIIQLQGVGFTNDQIRYLNNIKKEYGLESLNADGIVYIIGETTTTPELYTASYDKDRYPTLGDTDNEEDTDDGEGGNHSGGKKRTRRKRRSRYSTKRETRRRRKSIKRTQVARKKTRKSSRRRR